MILACWPVSEKPVIKEAEKTPVRVSSHIPTILDISSKEIRHHERRVGSEKRGLCFPTVSIKSRGTETRPFARSVFVF